MIPSSYLQTIITKLTPSCANKEHAEQEIWWIIEHVTQKNKLYWITHSSTLSQEQQKRVDSIIEQRLSGKPLQYILGSVSFCNLDIEVTPPILIPRPETEELTLWLIEQIKPYKKPFSILDLCTGSGCIALGLAAHLPHVHVTGVDINPIAISLADKNKKNLNLTNVTFIQSNLFEKLPPQAKFDLIVSNPPYLTPASYNLLEDSVRQWEDLNALIGGDDGMFFYRNIIRQAPLWLTPQQAPANHIPRLVFEIGPEQKPHYDIFKSNNHFPYATTHKDFCNKDRWISLFDTTK